MIVRKWKKVSIARRIVLRRKFLWKGAVPLIGWHWSSKSSNGGYRGESPAEAVFDAAAYEESNARSTERMNRLNKMLPRSNKFEKTAEDLEDDLLLSGGGVQRVGEKGDPGSSELVVLRVVAPER